MPQIRLEQVSKYYQQEKKAVPAVREIDLTIEQQEFVFVTGSSGAGKSTLLNLIAGEITPTAGAVYLDNVPIGQQRRFGHPRKAGCIGYVPQISQLMRKRTIEENLALAYSKNTKGLFRFAITKKDREMFCEALKRFDMGLEDRMATKIGLLSGGQRQVVTLLMSTIVTPKLLLLDEHTAALDPATAEKVMAITNDIVHERNLTTLMITHNMGQALTTGSRTIMLDSGAIIFDIKEEERKHMTVSDLLDMYSEKKKEEFDNDRILLN